MVNRFPETVTAPHSSPSDLKLSCKPKTEKKLRVRKTSQSVFAEFICDVLRVAVGFVPSFSHVIAKITPNMH